MLNLINRYISNCNYDDLTLVKKIIKVFFDKLADFLITTGEPVKLPHNLGNFRFFKYNTLRKIKPGQKINPMIDYNLTKKYKAQGKDIHIKLNNINTDNYWWIFKWYKNSKTPNLLSKSLYECVLVRTLRRGLNNSYNRHLNATDFFRDKGWQIYAKLPHSKQYLDKT